jgi:predicted protein tyrosine phosphatase
MALHPPILVLGFSEAAMFLRGAERPDVEGLIAIHSQREHAIETDGVPHRLVLQFDDCEAPSRTDLLQAARVRLRRRQREEFGLQEIFPTVDHARAIIDFAKSVRGIQGTLLCQCQGGISRSPAAALLCLATWTDPGWEQYCVRQLLMARPCAIPHPDIVAFGDELLQRRGKLIDALELSQAG